MLLKNHFENAAQALKANRGRTFLTIIGITVGIASITMVLSLASSVTKLFGGQQNINTNEPIAIIRSGGQKTGTNIFTEADGSTTVNTLTEQDVSDLGKIPNLKTAPIAFLHSELKARDGKVDTQKAAIVGSTGSLKPIANLEVSEGQFIDEADGIVVGQQLSVDLFGTDKSIGNVINIHGQPVTVAGVLKNVSHPAKHLNVDFNNAAIMPLSVIKRFTQNTAQIQQIAVAADSREQLQSGLSEAEKILHKNHDGNNDYRILTGNEINESKSNLVNLLSFVMAVIGSVSLIVGGVGIMNIMLVNVAERRREVGIRRAVGATGQHIINQFVIESAIVGLLGGIIGYVLGLCGAYIVGAYLSFTPYIYWQTIVITIFLSLLIGIIAGLYPAFRATKRDPIESLRY
mgnify:FL=1